MDGQPKITGITAHFDYQSTFRNQVPGMRTYNTGANQVIGLLVK